MHNSGMLPFMKEIVEILFADGLLKVVFATTTFAIGLNLPARSVLFTKVYKFSGGESEELLETSEYLQMAGRAGRRGKDSTGSCLLCLDRSFGRNIPTLEDFEKLLENKGTPLESKLKLSYNMTMNVVKSETMIIDDLLKQSWYENETQKERKIATTRANILIKRIAKIQEVDCPFGCTTQLAKDYAKYYTEACKQNWSISTVVARDLQPLFLFESMTPSHYGEVMIIITSISQQTNNENYLMCLYINTQNRRINRYEDEATEPAKIGTFRGLQYEYVKVNQNEIGVIFNESLHNNVKANLQLSKTGELVSIVVLLIYRYSLNWL